MVIYRLLLLCWHYYFWKQRLAIASMDSWSKGMKIFLSIQACQTITCLYSDYKNTFHRQKGYLLYKNTHIMTNTISDSCIIQKAVIVIWYSKTNAFIRFDHGPPSLIWPRRSSTRCNIHEVSLLSWPAIFESTKQSLDPVQYSWGFSFVTASHLGFLHAERRSGAIFMRRWPIRDYSECYSTSTWTLEVFVHMYNSVCF